MVATEPLRQQEGQREKKKRKKDINDIVYNILRKLGPLSGYRRVKLHHTEILCLLWLWYLYLMVTQNTLCTRKTGIFKFFKFATKVDLNKCLKRIKLLI